MKKELTVAIIGTFVGGLLLHSYIKQPESIPKFTSIPLQSNTDTFTSSEVKPLEKMVQLKQKLFLSKPLPQIWEGTFLQDNYGEYPMILYVENVFGDSIIGKINWQSLDNSVVSMSGQFVRDFSDFTELVRWKKLPKFDKNKENSWLFFSTHKLLRGTGVSIKGRYYVDVSVRETMRGISYSINGSSPSGKFNLRRTE